MILHLHVHVDAFFEIRSLKSAIGHHGIVYIDWWFDFETKANCMAQIGQQECQQVGDFNRFNMIQSC